MQFEEHSKYFRPTQTPSPKLSSTLRKCKTAWFLYPGEFLGEDIPEECSSETDEQSGASRSSTGTWGNEAGESFGNSQVHPTVRAIKSNPVVVGCLKKLDQLLEQEDIKRFSHRSDPAQNGAWRKSSSAASVHSDCCFAGNPPVEGDPLKKGSATAKDVEFGPFRSCPMRHSRSHDYDTIPTFQNTSEKSSGNELLYGNGYFQQLQYARPGSARANRPQTSVQSGSVKCRGCPKTSIFLPEPEMWHQDYKYQITYGRISTSHKKQLREKCQSWISSEDYKDRIHWLKTRNMASQKFQSSHHRSSNQFMGGIMTVDASSPRGTKTFVEETTPKFGPSAIASVSGYNYYRPSIKVMQPPQEAAKSPTGLVLNNTNNSTNAIDDSKGKIPWPSLNTWYYDNDDDPRITELLAKAPFCVVVPSNENPEDDATTPKIKSARDPLPPSKMRPTTSASARVQSNSKAALEYVVGIAHRGTTRQCEDVPKSSKPMNNKVPEISGLHQQNNHQMGDMLVNNMTPRNYSKASFKDLGIGDGGEPTFVSVKKVTEVNVKADSSTPRTPRHTPSDQKLIRNQTPPELKKLALAKKVNPTPTTSTQNDKPKPASPPTPTATPILKTKPPVVKTTRLRRKGQGLLKSKAIKKVRRFPQSITTVSLTVPMSKDSSVMNINDTAVVN